MEAVLWLLAPRDLGRVQLDPLQQDVSVVARLSGSPCFSNLHCPRDAPWSCRSLLENTYPLEVGMSVQHRTRPFVTMHKMARRLERPFPVAQACMPIQRLDLLGFNRNGLRNPDSASGPWNGTPPVRAGICLEKKKRKKEKKKRGAIKGGEIACEIYLSWRYGVHCEVGVQITRIVTDIFGSSATARNRATPVRGGS